MIGALDHRGPDGNGVHVSSSLPAGIGSTRLAIRDLSSAGDQPFVDKERGVSIVFNGEIYNADVLRDELRMLGVIFRSSSDTEVLLRLYCRYGADLLDRINGIFSFAILDERRGVLFLARDPLGVKPLYYMNREGTFAFASEIKSLLRHHGLSARLNESGIGEYLAFACSPGPTTLFRDINKLAPATLLEVKLGRAIEPRRYWSPVRPALMDLTARATAGECAELVRDTVRKAVKLQMASDVQPTCSLSGGVDSSTVAALMGKLLPAPRTYFTIGFDSRWQDYNEQPFARAVAREAEADLIELHASAADVIEFMRERYALHCDDPNADPTCCLAYFLARAMRQRGFKVAMSGEGADEIFIGYERHLQDLATWRQERSREVPNDDWYWGNATPFGMEALGRVLTPEFRSRALDFEQLSAPVGRAHQAALERLDPDDLPRRLSFMELQIRLPEILLARVDKMSMANSVEYRVPFLDKELVELAFAIPADVKLYGGRPKSVLKDAAEGIIPGANIHRKKVGFSFPLTEWLREPRIGAQFLEPLIQSRLLKSGLVDAAEVHRLIDAHRSGAADRNVQIWTLLTLALWFDRWIA